MTLKYTFRIYLGELLVQNTKTGQKALVEIWNIVKTLVSTVNTNVGMVIIKREKTQ